MRTKGLFFLILVSVFSCKESSKNLQRMKIEGNAQGTSYSIVYYSNNKLDKASIDSLLFDIDQSVSTYQQQSLISKFNRSKQGKLIDRVFRDNFLMSKKVYQETNGAFNPFAFPLFKIWKRYKEEQTYPTKDQIDSVLAYTNPDYFTLRNDSIVKSHTMSCLSFDAIAQGYSVDIISEFLRTQNINHFLVEVGGELKVSGYAYPESKKHWVVGIEKPVLNSTNRQLFLKVSLNSQAMATSGNYRNFYTKADKIIGHTINPKTGYPANNTLLSATVITNYSSAYADALATAFMVMGLDKTKHWLTMHRDIEVILLYTDKQDSITLWNTQRISKHIDRI